MEPRWVTLEFIDTGSVCNRIEVRCLACPGKADCHSGVAFGRSHDTLTRAGPILFQWHARHRMPLPTFGPMPLGSQLKAGMPQSIRIPS